MCVPINPSFSYLPRFRVCPVFDVTYFTVLHWMWLAWQEMVALRFDVMSIGTLMYMWWFWWYIYSICARQYMLWQHRKLNFHSSIAGCWDKLWSFPYSASASRLEWTEQVGQALQRTLHRSTATAMFRWPVLNCTEADWVTSLRISFSTKAFNLSELHLT
jgi:hypothetical protein